MNKKFWVHFDIISMNIRGDFHVFEHAVHTIIDYDCWKRKFDFWTIHIRVIFPIILPFRLLYFAQQKNFFIAPNIFFENFFPNSFKRILLRLSLWFLKFSKLAYGVLGWKIRYSQIFMDNSRNKRLLAFFFWNFPNGLSSIFFIFSIAVLIVMEIEQLLVFLFCVD